MRGVNVTVGVEVEIMQLLAMRGPLARAVPSL
jgi:hypothetical protein